MELPGVTAGLELGSIWHPSDPLSTSAHGNPSDAVQFLCLDVRGVPWDPLQDLSDSPLPVGERNCQESKTTLSHYLNARNPSWVHVCGPSCPPKAVHGLTHLLQAPNPGLLPHGPWKAEAAATAWAAQFLPPLCGSFWLSGCCRHVGSEAVITSPLSLSLCLSTA